MSEVDKGYPKQLYILPTDRCNLTCFFCMRRHLPMLAGGKSKMLRLEDLSKLANSIKRAEVIDVSGFGESFLHPQFEEILRYIYSLNPRKNLIQLITNGTLLSSQWAKLLSGHLASITISLNAASD